MKRNFKIIIEKRQNCGGYVKLVICGVRKNEEVIWAEIVCYFIYHHIRFIIVSYLFFFLTFKKCINT